MSRAQEVAAALLSIGAVRFNLAEPYSWSSGWLAPVYCDNRLTLSFPEIRNSITTSLCELQQEQFPETTAIAGIATAGIPQATLIADRTNLPLLYVRSKAKGHGLGNQIEGRLDSSQQILVVEDLVSTGKSSLNAVKALRDAGADVIGLLSIVHYGFPEAEALFRENELLFESLCSFEVLLEEAENQNLIPATTVEALRKWQADPANWRSENAPG